MKRKFEFWRDVVGPGSFDNPLFLRYDQIPTNVNEKQEVFTPLNFDAGLKVGSEDIISEYREESWEPNLNVDADYIHSFGGALKFGKICIISLDIKISKIHEDKNIYIQHVPFCAAPLGGGGTVGFFENMNLNFPLITGRIDNDTTIKLFTKNENKMEPLNTKHFKDKSRLIMSLEYRTI